MRAFCNVAHLRVNLSFLVATEYNYIYRFVVRDNNVNFMDESCGHIHQVDDTDIIVPGSAVRRRFVPPVIGITNDGRDSGNVSLESIQTMKRAGKSLMDESEDGLNTNGGGNQRRVKIEGMEGDLDDELGYIQAQLNASQQPPAIQTTLSNASS